MTYDVNWSVLESAGGKPRIFLDPLIARSDLTSLVLTGKGTPNYGVYQQENFLKLLENFASPDNIRPQNPTFGQLWFNVSDHSLYVYDTVGDLNDDPSTGVWKKVSSIFNNPNQPGTTINEGDLWWDATNKKLFVYVAAEWKQIYPSLSVVPVAYVEEYNALADLYNQVAGTPTGSTYATAYGYGQTDIPHVTRETLTNAKWVELIDKFRKVAAHQGTTTANFATRGFILDSTTLHGTVTAEAEYANTVANMFLTRDNRHNASPLSLQSDASQSTAYRTYAYYNAKVHDVYFEFASENHAKAFFNAGGKLTVSASFTPSQSTIFNTAWQSFIGSLGNLVINAEKTTYTGSPANAPGFYNLVMNGAAVTLRNQVSAVPGCFGAYYKVQASLYQAASKVILKVSTTFAPDGMNNIYTVYNSGNTQASGNTTSMVTATTASALNLDSPPIAWPTTTQSGTFISSSGL